MPAKNDSIKQTFMTLSELASIVRQTVDSISGDLWVVAELSEVNVNKYSGHCYMGLVEKKDEKLVAQMRATIWAGVYKRLSSVFRKATGSELKPGMKVLMRGSLGYHEVYGLSLNVREVDPQYTLGEMAMKRREILDRLKKEGLIDLNRALPLPEVPQRVAVISSETSAGYGDFISRLTGNPYGYGFSLSLYAAFMQGDRAEASIVNALKKISTRASDYDVVVLIRGGGSQVDLSCFDSYALASEMARMPIPVISGIGHERDETVADRVANQRLITPSAVAEFLVLRLRKFHERMETMRQRLVRRTNELLGFERHRLAMSGRGLATGARAYISELGHGLSGAADRFSSATRQGLRDSSMHIRGIAEGLRRGAGALLSLGMKALVTSGARLRTGAGYRLRQEPANIASISARLIRAPSGVITRGTMRLDTFESKSRLLDPVNVLRRGYSITTLKGAALRDASALSPGDTIRTRIYNADIESTVVDIKQDEKEGRDA